MVCVAFTQKKATGVKTTIEDKTKEMVVLRFKLKVGMQYKFRAGGPAIFIVVNY
jgi:hypothetical protein